MPAERRPQSILKHRLSHRVVLLTGQAGGRGPVVATGRADILVGSLGAPSPKP